MKTLMVAGLLVLALSGTAEASQFSDGLGKVWGYLTAPVNCVASLGADLVAVGAKFVTCVLNNANPKNLIP